MGRNFRGTSKRTGRSLVGRKRIGIKLYGVVTKEQIEGIIKRPCLVKEVSGFESCEIEHLHDTHVYGIHLTADEVRLIHQEHPVMRIYPRNIFDPHKLAKELGVKCSGKWQRPNLDGLRKTKKLITNKRRR
ncbi:MAG: hypothetical protein ACPGO5_04125 [Patescibacteria group bacterium]